MIPGQVEDKERTATVDGSKAKEAKLEVAGGKCWRRNWQIGLQSTGEIFNIFPMNVILATVKASQYVVKPFNISQRLGSCLSPSFVLWQST